MQKILITALVAGIVAGFLSFLVQSAKLNPLILQAETYEQNAPAEQGAGHEHNTNSHEHDSEAWAPEDGFERDAYRLLTDIGMGVGFALIMVGFFVLRNDNMNMDKGILWGVAGFATFSLAPSFGLPPELPTTLAAELQARQIWWVATVLATAFGLYAMVFNKNSIVKIIAAAIIAIPHMIGAPQAPLGGIVPTELNAQFAAASIGSMALFWLALGAVSGWLYGK
ncbi:MAG: CbtA family protein [Rickettsiales bacterium]